MLVTAASLTAVDHPPDCMCGALQVKREFCAECTRKLGYEKLALAAPCNGQMNITDNMQAELFEVAYSTTYACVEVSECVTPSP